MATVFFEPINEEIECGEDETVLDAAFRQGYSLVYGCREGQCSACKCFLLEGEVTLKRYSTFALSDSEEQSGYTLLCRAMPDSDLTVELLHVQENYRLEHAIRDGEGTVAVCEPMTSDIYRLVLDVDESVQFSPGQYMDLGVPGSASDQRRSFSMACTPASQQLEFLIKAYEGGAFADQLKAGIEPGTPISFTGPYGSLRMGASDRDVLMVAGGSGMAPVLSLLRELAATGSDRKIRFFYGARTSDDLFYGELIRELGSSLSDFEYVEVLSHAPEGSWDGATGWVHEVAATAIASGEVSEPEIYTCGPPPMVDALISELTTTFGVDEKEIHYDKFTTAVEDE
ncbi:MAG: 2Fe-2S iron-sulfur cluster-binding protein [Solirubrobacteraceae bacterium]